MKKFFRDYSYTTVRMFVYQIALSIFGLSLFLATVAVEMDWLTLVTGIFSMIFYLVLLYILTWEIGAKDRIATDYGKKKSRPYLGFVLSILANIPNVLLATFNAIAILLKWEAVQVISRLAAMAIQGMYAGVLFSIKIGSYNVTNYFVSFYIIIIPAILVCGIAYLAGFNNFRIIPQRNTENKKSK